MDSLTDEDVAILDLEKPFWKVRDAKEDAIRNQLGLTPTRYYQRLNQILDTPAAVAHDPVTVNRLRRIRSQRSENRQHAFS